MLKNLLYCCSFIVVSASCKKDSKNQVKDQITGKWSYVALIEHNYTEDGKLTRDSSVYNGKAGDSMEFKTDGTWSQNLGGFPGSGTYTITSSTRFELYNTGIDNPCRIVKLSSSVLVYIVEGPKRAGDGYKEYIHSLKK